MTRKVARTSGSGSGGSRRLIKQKSTNVAGAAAAATNYAAYMAASSEAGFKDKSVSQKLASILAKAPEQMLGMWRRRKAKGQGGTNQHQQQQQQRRSMAAPAGRRGRVGRVLNATELLRRMRERADNPFAEYDVLEKQRTLWGGAAP